MNGLKTILIMAVLAIGFAIVISEIDNPKPSRLAAKITKEIKEIVK